MTATLKRQIADRQGLEEESERIQEALILQELNPDLTILLDGVPVSELEARADEIGLELQAAPALPASPEVRAYEENKRLMFSSAEPWPIEAKIAQGHGVVTKRGTSREARATAGRSHGSRRSSSRSSSSSGDPDLSDSDEPEPGPRKRCKNPDCGGYAPPYSGRGCRPKYCKSKDCHDQREARRKRLERAKLAPREDLKDPTAEAVLGGEESIPAAHKRQTSHPEEGEAGRWEARRESLSERRKAKQSREKAAAALVAGDGVNCTACAGIFLEFGARESCSACLTEAEKKRERERQARQERVAAELRRAIKGLVLKQRAENVVHLAAFAPNSTPCYEAKAAA